MLTAYMNLELVIIVLEILKEHLIIFQYTKKFVINVVMKKKYNIVSNGYSNYRHMYMLEEG